MSQGSVENREDIVFTDNSELVGAGGPFVKLENDVSDSRESRIKRSGLGVIKYGLTTLLSLASGLALESVCVPVGTITAGINPFQNVTPEIALALLGVTYIAWGSGIWINYNQTWKLLEETGISSSVGAKIGYDFSTSIVNNRLFKKVPRVANFVRRSATLGGFIAVEVGKEAPYYGLAFGGKVFIENFTPDIYTPNMEISFLAGANVAAAVFNGVQAVGIEGFLRFYKGRDRIINGVKRFFGEDSK